MTVPRRQNACLSIITFILFAFTIGCSSLRLDTGTSIVIVATPEEIVIAADSMLTHGDSLDPPSFTECKIKRTEEAFFALAGYTRVFQYKSTFDAAKIAIDAFNGPGNAVEKVKRFDQRIVEPLKDIAQAARKTMPAYFVNQMKNKLILQAAFFGFERGALYLYLRDFKTNSFDSDDIVIEASDVYDCLGDCNKIIFLGGGEAGINFLTANPDYKATRLDLVRKLVAIEIENTPDKSAAPVDILLLNKNGPTWIQRKSECIE